ncbi:MAG: hypothetical protein J5802_14265 [Butyrivibrio sp.]|nr:hypothetical protein [Butyrivibrio sp.]
MKDFERLRRDCMREVEAAGICISDRITFEINRRARTRWGLCKKNRDGSFRIQIAEILLADERISEKSCKETIIHELLHTCEGCMRHTGRWKQNALKMNSLYGYDIKRVTTGSEKGIEDYKSSELPVKYVFKCKSCGAVIYRKRESRFTRNYRHYICTRCGCAAWSRRKVDGENGNMVLCSGEY